MRSAYVELVVAQETQKTLLDLYQLASRLLYVAQKRFQAGDVPELDVLKGTLRSITSRGGCGGRQQTRYAG